MRQYHFTIETINRRLRWLVATWVVISVATLSAAGILLSSRFQPGGAIQAWPLWAVILFLFMAGMLAFGIYRAYQRQRGQLAAVQIEMGDETIASPDNVFPRIEVRRDEITLIQEVDNGLVVMADNPRRGFVVPNGIEDYQSVRTTLDTWSPIKPTTSKAWLRKWLLIGSIVAAFLVLIFAWSLWLLVPVAALMVAGFVRFLWMLRGTLKTKPSLFIRMAVLLLIITAAIALKLTMAFAATGYSR